MTKEESRTPYKEKRPFFHRQMEITYIRSRYPTKIPMVLERYKKEKNLPHLDKIKFLVPQEMNLGQFMTVIRNRLQVHSSQAIFVTVAGRNLPTLTLTMSEIYTSYMDEDGFLYVNYASEEMFG